MEIYDLGALIKKLRKEKGLTLKKLADRIGVSEATVSKYESNLCTPSLDKMRSLASIFNVSMDTLFGMPQQGTISVQGLTDTQTDTVRELIEAYRVRNARPGRSPTPEQMEVLGRITAEIMKKS